MQFGSLGWQVQSFGIEVSLGEIAVVCTDWTLLAVVVGNGLVMVVGAGEIDWTTRSRMAMLEIIFYKIASA